MMLVMSVRFILMLILVRGRRKRNEARAVGSSPRRRDCFESWKEVCQEIYRVDEGMIRQLLACCCFEAVDLEFGAID